KTFSSRASCWRLVESMSTQSVPWASRTALAISRTLRSRVTADPSAATRKQRGSFESGVPLAPASAAVGRTGRSVSGGTGSLTEPGVQGMADVRVGKVPASRWACSTITLPTVNVRIGDGDAAAVIEGVTRRYGRRWALRGVTLSVAAGEVVGVEGHNGSGKSTLLRILSTAIKPTGGKARVYGA